jgi:ankyrin repeat protein
MLNTEINKEPDNKLLNESLFKATAKGSLKKVKSLIAQGADINFQDKHGASVLMQAVIHNNTKIVLLLLDLKVNVDLADKDAGDTEEASNRLKF